MARGQEAQERPVSVMCSHALLMHRGVGTVWRPLPQPLCPLQATTAVLRKPGHAPGWRGEAVLCGPRGKEVFKQFLVRPWRVDSKLTPLTRAMTIAVLPLAVLEELNWHVSTLGDARNQLEADLCGHDTRPGMTVETTPNEKAPEAVSQRQRPRQRPAWGTHGDTLPAQLLRSAEMFHVHSACLWEIYT